jgi:hypothetical protein
MSRGFSLSQEAGRLITPGVLSGKVLWNHCTGAARNIN